MMIDDSQLTADQIELIQRWANDLDVSEAVLLGRLVAAHVEGELYTEGLPDQSWLAP